MSWADGGAGEAVHRKEADGVVIEHGREHAAHGALLGPDLTRWRLLVPEVAAIGEGDAAGVFSGSFHVDTRSMARVSSTIQSHGMMPCSRASAAGDRRAPSRCAPSSDQAPGKQLVADAAPGDRLRGLCDSMHRLDQIERALRHATTFSGTGSRIVALL